MYAPPISLCCKSNGVVTTPPSQAPFCQVTQQQATASPKTYRIINANPAHDQLPVTTFPAPLPTSKCTTAMPPQPVTLSDFIVFSPHGRAQLHTHRTFTARSPPCLFYLHKFASRSLRMAKTRCMRQVLSRRCNVKTCCSKGNTYTSTVFARSPVPS